MKEEQAAYSAHYWFLFSSGRLCCINHHSFLCTQAHHIHCDPKLSYMYLILSTAALYKLLAWKTSLSPTKESTAYSCHFYPHAAD